MQGIYYCACFSVYLFDINIRGSIKSFIIRLLGPLPFHFSQKSSCFTKENPFSKGQHGQSSISFSFCTSASPPCSLSSQLGLFFSTAFLIRQTAAISLSHLITDLASFFTVRGDRAPAESWFCSLECCPISLVTLISGTLGVGSKLLYFFKNLVSLYQNSACNSPKLY